MDDHLVWQRLYVLRGKRGGGREKEGEGREEEGERGKKGKEE